MADPNQPLGMDDGVPMTGLRLIRVIVLETLAVLLLGLLVFGVLWDMGFFRAGLIAGIGIWVLVSPTIEIATVLRLRSPGSPAGSPPATTDRPRDQQRSV